MVDSPCSIRHIRCDNTHPACRKCSSTGRTCEWYQEDLAISWVIQNDCARQRVPICALPGAHSIEPLEYRSLQYYQNNTSQHLAGYADGNFWTKLVLQVGYREPCVRYALVALGSLHEAFQDEHFSNSRLFPHETPSGRYSWYTYTKAIALLNAHIDRNSWQGVDIALLCCVLCVGFEWMRGCYVAAETHVRSGLAILNQWTEFIGDAGGKVVACSPTAHWIRTQLAPLFARLANQTRTFIATPVPWTALLVGNHQPEPSDDLKVARDKIYAIISDSYMDSHGMQPTALYEKRATLKRKLESWRLAHVDILAMAGRDNICLLISFTLIWIMVESSASTDEMQFDRFLVQFNLVVELAENLSSMEGPDHFDVDIELVPVLYYVAIKCRHPTIRRRAIALLNACPRRLGLWDGICTARVAQEVVDIEEDGREAIVGQSNIGANARVCRLYVWTYWDSRKSLIKFKRPGMLNWSRERIVQW